MKASLNNYRQAPRKVRLIANEIRGKQVPVVLDQLVFMPQKTALPLRKLVESAVANAKRADERVEAESLYVESITVDKGRTFVRYMPRAFGRAAPINRESSHVKLTLGTRAPKAVKAAKSKTK